MEKKKMKTKNAIAMDPGNLILSVMDSNQIDSPIYQIYILSKLFYSRVTVKKLHENTCRVEYADEESVRVCWEYLRPVSMFVFGGGDEVFPGLCVEAEFKGEFWMGTLVDRPDDNSDWEVLIDYSSEVGKFPLEKIIPSVVWTNRSWENVGSRWTHMEID